MAWGGHGGRMSSKQVVLMRRMWKPTQRPELPTPSAIPTSVLKQIGREGITDKEAYGRRLQELLAAYKQEV